MAFTPNAINPVVAAYDALNAAAKGFNAAVEIKDYVSAGPAVTSVEAALIRAKAFIASPIGVTSLAAEQLLESLRELYSRTSSNLNVYQGYMAAAARQLTLLRQGEQATVALNRLEPQSTGNLPSATPDKLPPVDLTWLGTVKTEWDSKCAGIRTLDQAQYDECGSLRTKLCSVGSCPAEQNWTLEKQQVENAVDSGTTAAVIHPTQEVPRPPQLVPRVPPTGAEIYATMPVPRPRASQIDAMMRAWNSKCAGDRSLYQSGYNGCMEMNRMLCSVGRCPKIPKWTIISRPEYPTIIYPDGTPPVVPPVVPPEAIPPEATPPEVPPEATPPVPPTVQSPNDWTTYQGQVLDLAYPDEYMPLSPYTPEEAFVAPPEMLPPEPFQQQLQVEKKQDWVLPAAIVGAAALAYVVFVPQTGALATISASIRKTMGMAKKNPKRRRYDKRK